MYETNDAIDNRLCDRRMFSRRGRRFCFSDRAGYESSGAVIVAAIAFAGANQLGNRGAGVFAIFLISAGFGYAALVVVRKQPLPCRYRDDRDDELDGFPRLGYVSGLSSGQNQG
jgi:hypothetical protein